MKSRLQKPSPEESPFDAAKSPLEGIHLIEAGAGAGKTYALTSLFIRFLLEKKLSAKEILVVTYTVAATKELRGRIRRKVREALNAFSGTGTKDPFVASLVEKHDPDTSRRLLEEALHDLDAASIFTIHGFCQRILREHAFESGATFDAELLADDSELRSEVLDDFWRTRFYAADKDFFRFARKSCALKKLRELLAKGVAQPRIEILPETGPVEMPPLAEVKKMFQGLRQAWPGARDQILKALSSPCLNRTRYRNPAKILQGIDDYLSGETVFPVLRDLQKLTPLYLDAYVNKGNDCPRHPFFDSCGEFYNAAIIIEEEMARKVLSLKSEMFRYFRSEFARRKQALNVQSFEDLLNRVGNALQGRRGEALAEAVRRRYKAALVDEFQDTDPVQYSIFSRIFGDGGTLFLIGDPKQAIYGFRGADLFTYLQASSEVKEQHSLLTNRRSESRLIDAVNALFARARNPFLLEGIKFRDALSEPHDDFKPLIFKGEEQDRPFHIWFVPGREKPLPKGVARAMIARAAAAEIARLVRLGRQGEAMLGDRALREADVAVLVRKHSEARLVQRALRDKGIISVLYSDADLFATEEAAELDRVLRAIAEPASERAFRAALSTDLMGLTAEALEALLSEAGGREEKRARFRRWREKWERDGFLAMYRQLLAEEKVRERLVARPDGERRITNYLHLGELLHREAAERKLAVSTLADWLALRRSEQEESAQAPEVRQLRLESDADAVKVMTIHMSKGLEFPVVFCPFNWDGRMDVKDYLLYHDGADGWKLKLALASPGPAFEDQARMEVLAENVRLLYVSLTRAKNRCYLVWGRIADFLTSGASYILHPAGAGQGATIDELKRGLKDLSGAELRAELDALQENSQGAVSIMTIPADASTAPPPREVKSGTLRLREFKGTVERDWRIASFSSLSAHQGRQPESPDHDGWSAEYQAEPSAEKTITNFPRGASAGTFFHKLFEELDFSGSGDIDRLTAEKLTEYGYGLEWAGPVSAMVRNVLAANLDGSGMRLAGVSGSQRLQELGFYIPLKRVSPESLGRIFSTQPHGRFPYSPAFPEKLGNLEFEPCRGFMRGFIDLVFPLNGKYYLLDWKSNFLGYGSDDYSPERLAASMEEHFYYLQYHLYCLALHKYLQLRLPGYSYETQFGGVFYIYLRAFGEPGANGIFRDRPEKALIEALENGLVSPASPGGRGVPDE